jgi:hypothetical protein
MFNLYPIVNEYINAFSELSSNEDIPEEAIKDTLEALEGEFKDKILNMVSFAKNLEAEEKAIKDAEQNMKDRREKLARKKELIYEYIKQGLEQTGVVNVSSELFDVKLQKNPPSVQLFDEGILPKEYFVVKTVEQVNKAAIKEAISNGIEVPGASLSQLNRLVIK